MTDTQAAYAANAFATRPPDDEPILCEVCEDPENPIRDGDEFYYIDGCDVHIKCIDTFIERFRTVM